MDRSRLGTWLLCVVCACGTSQGTPGDAGPDAGGAPSSRWTRRCGGDAEETPVALAVEASREIFVAATTRSPRFDFGGGGFDCAPPCIALGALDADGAEVWSLPLAPGGTARLNALAADVAGGVILAGDLLASTDLSGPPLVAPACTDDAHPDAFLSRFDDSGFFLWQRRLGDCDAQTATAVAADGTDILVAGSFRSTLDFGLGPVAALGARDLFVARFDAGGTAAWGKGFGASGSVDDTVTLRALAVDGASSVLVVGSAVDVVDLGGGPLTPRGDRDVFVAALDANGVHRWSRRFGDAGAQEASSIAPDGEGGVVVAGVTQGSIDFGGGALAGDGVYVAALASDGTHRWSRLFPSSSARVGRVRVDPSGAVLLAGTFQGTLDFGGGAIAGGDPAASAAFLVELDASGAHVWSRAFAGAPGNVGASDLALDVHGTIVLLGSFSGAFDAFTDLGDGDLFVETLAR
jgi:hypothetical protein